MPVQNLIFREYDQRSMGFIFMYKSDSKRNRNMDFTRHNEILYAGKHKETTKHTTIT